MTAPTGQPAHEPGSRHPDTVIVDELTAFLNREPDPSGADLVSLLCQLVAATARPLLTETWPIDTEVDEDRYGIATATVTAGPYTIRVSQADQRIADLTVDITTENGDDYGLTVTVDGRPVLDPMPYVERQQQRPTGSATHPAGAVPLTTPAHTPTTWRQTPMATDTTPSAAGSPQHVTLPNSLVRAITLVAADPTGPSIAAVEAAVLITLGYALYRRQDCIDPTRVSIPAAQWQAIATALTTVPDASATTRVNLSLDWINLGPVSHGDDPT